MGAGQKPRESPLEKLTTKTVKTFWMSRRKSEILPMSTVVSECTADDDLQKSKVFAL